MVHSIELVFDADTEAAIRHIWDELREAGIPSQAPASRPHATLTVAERIDPEVDELLAALADRFPLPCRIGAPLFFGRAKAVLARLVVPTAALLDVHAEVHRLACRTCIRARWPNAMPDEWTAHVTMARRVMPAQMGHAVRIAGKPQEIKGAIAGLRRWDGNAKRRVSDQLTVAATLFGTHIRQPSITSSRSSSGSIASSRTSIQLYRSSDSRGSMNLSGSAATIAARSSLGKPTPITVSSRENAT